MSFVFSSDFDNLFLYQDMERFTSKIAHKKGVSFLFWMDLYFWFKGLSFLANYAVMFCSLLKPVWWPFSCKSLCHLVSVAICIIDNHTHHSFSYDNIVGILQYDKITMRLKIQTKNKWQSIAYSETQNAE